MRVHPAHRAQTPDIAPGPPPASLSQTDEARRPRWRRHSAPGGAPQLFDFKGAIRAALADLFPAEQDPDFSHLDRWAWFAPHLARGMLQPPHDVAHVLSYLDHPAFAGHRVALGRALVDEVQQAPTDVWPRRLVVQEAILLGLQARYPTDGAIEADLVDLYDAMGTVEARAKASDASPAYEVAWMRTSLRQLLHRAKRLDQARCMKAHTSFFIGGALFAALHLSVGALFGVASGLAWLVGVPGCFELALVFLACGTGIAVGWTCFYGMMWAYHRLAPWETGSRDADLEGPAFTPPPDAPLEPDPPRPNAEMLRRHSCGG